MIPNESNRSLIQRKLFGRTQTFEILPDSEIAISVKNPGSFDSWKWPLRHFESTYSRAKGRHLQPLILVVPFGLITLGTLWGIIYNLCTGVPIGGLVVVAVIMGSITGLFAYVITRKSYDVINFASEGGAKLTLWYNNPSPAKFEAFVEELCKAIQKARDLPPPPDSSPSLTAELNRLRELHQAGQLSDAQYEAGKNKLLGIEPEKRIGF